MTFSHALINGELMPFQKVTLPINHPSLFTGYGVYESIQVLKGQPFHLAEHLTRLAGSATILAIKLPSPETLSAWSEKLISALSTQSYTLKILVLGANTAKEASSIALFPQATPTYSADYYTFGAKAISFAGERILPQCKSLNTLISYLGRLAANKADALEAIFTADDNIYEGTRSNLFVVDAHTGRLLTPPAETTLSGVTKDLVAQIMAHTPTPVIEKLIPIECPIAEMFITSTSMHVMPITNFDGRLVGDGKVGTITKSVSRAFEDYHRQYYANIPLPHLDNLG